jgi:hypothetical protein
MIGHVSGKPKISGRRPSRLRMTDIIIHRRRRYDTASSQPTRIGKPSPASSVVVS